MNDRIDFTNCERVFSKAYNGANGKKIAVKYKDELYMLKFPPSAENKPTDLSYINSCISEHIACSIYNMIGVQVQKTILGTFNVNGKEKMFVRVKILHLMEKFFTIIDSEYNGNGTELTDILETIEKQQFVNPEKLSSYSGEVVLVGINYSTNPDTDYKKYTCKIEKISINN